MAKTKKKRPAKRKSSGERGSHVTGRPRKGKGDEAVRGMAMGGLIILIATLFFFLPIGGKTPFNHLLDLAGLGDSEAPVEEPAETKKSSRAAPVKTTRAPKFARNAKKARPMEAIHTSEQAGLDKLIEAKTK
jgi:hypothetical protein